MRYLLAGDGTMPLKEIPDVLQDLKITEDDELFYVFTKGTRFKVGEAILSSGLFGTFTVAVVEEELADELTPDLGKEADDIVLFEPETDLDGEYVVLALLPGADDPDDTFLEDLVFTAQDGGNRCLAMNEQLYDLAAEPEDGAAPAEDAPAAPADEEPVEAEVVEDTAPAGIPTVAEMEALTRGDLKALAKSVNAQPVDWRSKKAIIDGILETQTDQGEPFAAPAEPEVDLDALEAEVGTISSSTYLGDGEASTTVIDKLLADIVVAIQVARKALKDLS